MSTNTYSLRLPPSLKAVIMKVAKEEGFSFNQFVVVAVAEKLSAIRTADYFAERAKRGDLEWFRQFLTRTGGEPPREGDELPEGWKE